MTERAKTKDIVLEGARARPSRTMAERPFRRSGETAVPPDPKKIRGQVAMGGLINDTAELMLYVADYIVYTEECLQIAEQRAETFEELFRETHKELTEERMRYQSLNARIGIIEAQLTAARTERDDYASDLVYARRNEREFRARLARYEPEPSDTDS